jgi:uncharacterized cofD-like protein
MRFIDWLKPGVKVKRWVLLGALGILMIAFGLVEWIQHRFYSPYYISFYVFLITAGSFILYTAVTQGMKSFIFLINKGYINVSLDSKKIENLIYEKRLLVKGPKLVVIGGGTGLSTMLRGLKLYTSNITAIVTVADDGGGSGDLRQDLGILPPGDIRNCILALADTEPLMEDLLQYRFQGGRLENQSFGNLFLAAMDGISSSFEEAIEKMSSVLAVTGKVLPVTSQCISLHAKLKNGTIVEGESKIPEEVVKNNTQIDSVFLNPSNVKAQRDAIQAIKDADAVILGPGSLYTSVIPNLLVKDIESAVEKTNAIKIYVSNIMTQRGETDGYGVADHIRAIFKHGGKNLVDYVIVNIGKIDKKLEERYLEETARLVTIDKPKVEELGVKVIEGDFIKINERGLIRHDAEKLATILIETIMEKKLLYDKKKIIEYLYVSGRLKEHKETKKH